MNLKYKELSMRQQLEEMTPELEMAKAKIDTLEQSLIFL